MKNKSELRMRWGMCKGFLKFAWLSLRYPSVLTSAVFINMARAEGDALINGITTHDGKYYKIPNIHEADDNV
jgi:hypothetical protein